MEDIVFERCQIVNNLLIAEKENEARQELIRLLDFHESNKIEYTPLLNHLIRETGLFPYLEPKTSNWEERFVFDVFKVDVGEEKPLTLHREQSLLLKKLLDGKNIAVSAPTSFGKSFVIDAFIKIKKPKNVLIIVPTIALTDETRRRLYKKFASEYKIITTTEVELAEKNIFIFPQERAINYLNKVESFDIMIIDEFYKASKNFDKERSPSLIKAIIQLGNKSKQRYFLAPNISSLEENPFTREMEFIKLDFNTVFLEVNEIYLEIGKNEELKTEKLIGILKAQDTKSLIYAGTYSNIDVLSNIINIRFEEKNSVLLNNFSNWLSKNYSYNWSLTNSVKRGTGIHNGRLHRSLSQIQVKLFEEEDGLNNIISTSSIIEGVNTSAENVILWMNKNGRSGLNDFTYRNIIGRGGRMFRHFIGKIYILDKPPASEQTKLDLPFPEEILGGLDSENDIGVLTKEQVAKIQYYQEEMSNILGVDIYKKLKNEGVFQSSDSEFIKDIAVDMANNPSEWNGLSYLNSSNRDKWDKSIYRIINLKPGYWETKSSTFVAFIKVLRDNWFKSIPELLKSLEPHNVGIDDFFKLERNVSFKFSSLVKDVNTLQKEILKSKNYDISPFVTYVSHAFLPSVVFQLEEYGLPRIISKKIHAAKIINFYDRELTIHRTIEIFNEIGVEVIKEKVNLDEFDKYILDYFYDGIKINNNLIV
ncbi:DEAD/DEAH box helicase [Flavobacterium sp. NRK F7]|uniref:DEAD/DEAH box helicase n=1 Tax=Flavobacterium sp. NRK F7 TaxID=2954930 RepID=UPI0020911EB4|nr:DEAD/DEAH box helicase [Flavobacterium sp. NRK F7]MCO6162333.1 DEAD/DEAH box helicase [Flavobacterium sp. NRK F7]